MKPIGPDHPITVTAHPRRVRVMFQEHLIGDSADVLRMQESTYRPVFYFPRQDVSMEFLTRTEHSTHCPFKGDASYYSLMMDGHLEENAVWTYETPFDQMNTIAGRLAFYPDKVQIYEVDDEAQRVETTDEIREAVLHTDSGSGASQKEHWAPNVTAPGT